MDLVREFINRISDLERENRELRAEVKVLKNSIQEAREFACAVEKNSDFAFQMTQARLAEIKRHFIDEMPATWPESYREVVIELVAEVEFLQEQVKSARERMG